MKLVEYYKSVLGVLGLNTTEDGFITLDKEGEQLWINSGKSIVLPTKEHISTLISEDDDGKPVVTKVLYNPLDENVVRGDSVSIKKTKEAAELKLSHAIVTAGTMLLSLSTLKKQPNVPMYIQSFLASLKDVVTTANMVPVDDKSIDLWNKLYVQSFKQNVSVSKIFLKKGGIDSNNVKYNRLATVKFPLYEHIKDADDDKNVLGVKLRNKDIKVFKLIFEFLLKDDNLTKLEFGSNDGESPAFIALMSLYVTHSKFVSKVIKAIKFVGEEFYDSAYIDINMSVDDMDVGSVYSKELMAVPTDVSVNRSLTGTQNNEPVTNNVPVIDPMSNQRNFKTVATQPVVNQQPVQHVQQPNVMTPNTYAPQQQVVQQQVAVTPEDANMSAIDKILFGTGEQLPVIQQQQQQPNMVMPQASMSNGYNSVPMGIDSVPQQQIQQPMYGQPMYGQQQGYQQQQQSYGGMYQPNQSVYNPMS